MCTLNYNLYPDKILTQCTNQEHEHGYLNIIDDRELDSIKEFNIILAFIVDKMLRFRMPVPVMKMKIEEVHNQISFFLCDLHSLSSHQQISSKRYQCVTSQRLYNLEQSGTWHVVFEYSRISIIRTGINQPFD